MRFTIINMGKTDFVLRRGDPIVTLLFMKLTQSVQKDWLVRHHGATGKPLPLLYEFCELAPNLQTLRHPLHRQFLALFRAVEKIKVD